MAMLAPDVESLSADELAHLGFPDIFVDRSGPLDWGNVKSPRETNSTTKSADLDVSKEPKGDECDDSNCLDDEGQPRPSYPLFEPTGSGAGNETNGARQIIEACNSMISAHVSGLLNRDFACVLESRLSEHIKRAVFKQLTVEGKKKVRLGSSDQTTWDFLLRLIN